MVGFRCSKWIILPKYNRLNLKREFYMKSSIFFQMLTMIPSLLIGSIVETNRFDDILIYIDQTSPRKTIVVCDLDNTLIVPCEPLGSVAWAEYLQHKLQSKGVSKKDSEVVEHILWKTIQPHIEMQTVDPKTSEVINELKKRQIPILGLTARFPEDSWFTFAQLQSVDIDLSLQKDLPQVNLQLPLEPYASYEKGVLFSTTVNKKSAVLIKFLELHKMNLECVIFVDDKHHHVEDVENACKKLGIQCIGVRFSGADEYFKTFNSSKAELQWEIFPNKIKAQ